MKQTPEQELIVPCDAPFIDSNPIKQKIGYKGFDKNLQCRGEQFVIGDTYTKPKPLATQLRCCTSFGFHYCNDLKHVYEYYPISEGNRFCEIEILGDFKDQWNKSITTSFRIVKEITQEVYKKKTFEDMRLDDVKHLQNKYPHLHVGGSVGLFLHGIVTDRVKKGGVTDIDITTPYFTLIESDDKNTVEEVDLSEDEYGDDFDSAIFFNGSKVEIKIDPKQRYEVVEYEGFKYKVTALETIIDYKTKYALKGSKKHKQDLYELLGKKYYNQKQQKPLDDLPY